MNNKLAKNIIANYASKIWGFVSVFIFIPFYIKLLGMETYSVISFYTVILTVLLFADAGLSATLSREMAKTTNKPYLGNLLFTIERFYVLICAILSLAVLLASPFIAANWLKTDLYSPFELSAFVALMGVSVALQLFTTLYNSGLMGLQKQVKANFLQVSFSFLRSGLVLVPLFFMPSLWVYFLWQLAVGIIFLWINRKVLWIEIKEPGHKYVFNKDVLQTVGKFALGMMAMAILASLNTQFDKIVVGKLLGLVEFGYYSLAGTLAQLPVIIISPIAFAILPNMTKFCAERNTSELVSMFHLYASIISIIACAVCLPVVLFSEQIIHLWTHDATISANIKFVTATLTLGSLFLSMQYMPYQLAIANGHTKTNIVLSIIGISITIPMLFLLIKQFGFNGAGFPWLFLNGFFFLILGFLIINRFLKGEFTLWIIKDIGLPIIISGVIGLLVKLIQLTPQSHGSTIFMSSVISITALVAMYLIHNFLFKKHPIQLKPFASKS